MAQDDNKPAGPDLTKGIPSTDLADGKMLTGLVGDEEVLLVRQGGAVHAIGAHCTHYHGPLKDGLLVGDTVRCPWHHACFSLKTGEALAPPALSPLPCWRVDERDGMIVVKDKIEPASPPPTGKASEHFVIVGGGAAGFAAAQKLRHRGFTGKVTMLSNDTAAPVDRPNLSKDYLAGSAPEDWVPLRGEDWYAENKINLRLGVDVTSLDSQAKKVTLTGGETLTFDKLLLATGAEPVKLNIPGVDQGHVHTLRTLADSRAIIHLAKNAKSAVVIGASFIGLEAAASLRARELEVHVVAPEKRPLERVFGPQFGDFVRTLHEEHGVHFHLENSVTAIGAHDVTLKSGDSLAADLVVMGVGVRPRLTLAEKAGLRMDKGLAVNEYLETSAPDIYAAGDIARWPDPISGANIRVEHWVVAERQGQIAACNMLGERIPYRAVPFFWSQHYDVPINYVGHAEGWDRIDMDGDPIKRDCVARYVKGGKVLAVASIYRDLDSLKAAVEMGQIVKSKAP
ncbi:MAG: Ferredoxin reductase [Pseudolabrys sp.]|jgi:NADPH-dependent 2,4-dienoyl-CoA reductase/sulfur reductase-like enzyme/nitrite reductase/ring-hydroxylating ferredoxin subunit|nr:Ferredoxin reductase [Pseudolabrys sp.]